MKAYIGVKLIKAKSMTRGEYNEFKGWDIPANENPDDLGYLVQYGDDYCSWSPKDVFESAYLSLEDPTKINPADIENMLFLEEATQIDEKTTLVKANTLTGFVQYEPSSCVDPANYNHEVGSQVGMDRIKNRMWPLMGFVLSWGKNGLRQG